MTQRSRLRARLRNAVMRAVQRVPRRAISPVVTNDLFHAHQSLFEFLGAFTSQRNVLLLGGEAYGARTIRQGAASLTAVLDSTSSLRYGRRTFAEPGLDFRSTTPDGERYDVVIGHGSRHDPSILARSLRQNGKLLLAIPPSEDTPPLRNALAAQFAHLHRFAHLAHAPLDLSSPHGSAPPANAFEFRELDPEAPPPANVVGSIWLATNEPKWGDLQLHLGCGPVTLDNWINIDNQPYAGIDFRWDLARGIPFRNARHVFAEHFIEHLSYQQGVTFTRGCRDALREDGILRLSTPNLDWVWRVSYHADHTTGDERALADCFVINRAFRGWGHQFLYNLTTLTTLLQNSGFETVRALSYGQSDTPALAGIERHELYPDTPDLPHVLVIEASGHREPETLRGESQIAEYNRDVATI